MTRLKFRNFFRLTNFNSRLEYSIARGYRKHGVVARVQSSIVELRVTSYVCGRARNFRFPARSGFWRLSTFHDLNVILAKKRHFFIGFIDERSYEIDEFGEKRTCRKL